MNQKQFSNSKGFTLVELIVVIVIMTMLAGLSSLAYRGISDDLKMSSAMNTISTALDNARATAIKKNRYVITTFSPRLSEDGTVQVIDIIVSEWTGDSANADRGTGTIWTYDRFTPIRGMEIRTIDEGINVAGPGYGTLEDEVWWVCTYLPAIIGSTPTEPYGSMVGVLYSPEGRVVTRNAESGADRIWVDFNQDGVQTISDAEEVDWPWPNPLPGTGAYFDIEIQGGEPFVSMTPILAVFNEEEFRLSVIPEVWDDANDRDEAYSDYIDKNSNRIQFNRYSGVPLE